MFTLTQRSPVLLRQAALERWLSEMLQTNALISYFD